MRKRHVSLDFRQKRAVKAGIVIHLVVNSSLTPSPLGSPLLFPLWHYLGTLVSGMKNDYSSANAFICKCPEELCSAVTWSSSRVTACQQRLILVNKILSFRNSHDELKQVGSKDLPTCEMQDSCKSPWFLTSQTQMTQGPGR